VLWARFPLADTAPLVNLARRHGVRVVPGSIHTADKSPGPFIRIDVDRPAGLISEGLNRLARAWHDLIGDG